ncbi:MAG TPA: GNAT family N-acetyltransferase [Solirubrobacterales bacterium]|nr:GNAT family N-acetyltransferase [Solirubrobacterales bacterium]
MEGGPVRVRDARPDDTEAIVAVTAAGWRTAYRDIVALDRLADLPIPRWRHEVHVGLRRPVEDAFSYVAEIDGEFAGYCFVAAPSRERELGRNVAELVAIYVDPDRWGQGAGAALMRAAMDRLSQLPYDEVFLWTFKENGPAIAFYERHGWRADGNEKVHPRSQAVAIRLRRPTGSATVE